MNEYRDTVASILSFCKDFCAELNGQGFDVEVINFDASGGPAEWSAKDVVGPAEMMLTMDDGNIQIQTMIAISTVEDTNNFRLQNFMNQLLNKLIPGKRMKLVNANTGATRGFMVVRDGTRITAPEATKTRVVQPIMINMLSDQTVRV